MKKSIYTSEYASLCRTLQAVRESAGLSQRALAARLRVTPSWVAKVEIGERRIDLVEFVRFVSACGGDAVAVFSEAAAQVRMPKMKGGKRGGRDG